MGTEKMKKRSYWKRLRDKYRLIILDETTLETKSSFLLSRLNVFALFSTVIVLLSLGVLALIFYTPFRQYLPDSHDGQFRSELYQLNLKTDSLERVAQARSAYLSNIRNILDGKVDSLVVDDTIANEATETDLILTTSQEDSIFRLQMDSIEQGFLLNQEKLGDNRFGDLNFYTPVQGFISAGFDAEEDHYAIDIVAPENEPIKAVLDGRVIMADWTLDAGYVLIIQHDNDLISAYKHNSVLLKKVGNFVKAGDVIAIIGNSGELTSGSHLHFELWNDGIALDPQKFIHF